MKIRLNWAPMVLIVLSVILTGCITMPRTEEAAYIPGSDPAVQTAKSGMTMSNAVDLLSKYIVQFVDKTAPEANSSDPFSQALTAKGRQPTTTTNGYFYVHTSVVRFGNQMNVSIGRTDYKFADVVRVVVVSRSRGETSKPVRIVLYDKKKERFLECPMAGSEALVPRVLAAVELLCPNVGKGDADLPLKTEPVKP